MTSKTSNKREGVKRCMSLMAWTVKKYKYTLLIYTVLLFLSFPMMGIFCITGNTPMTFEKNDSGFVMFNLLFSTLAVVFSVIISFINFSYMQKKKSVDFYFAFPMTRRSMFVSKYLASILMSVAPMAAVAFIGLLIQIGTINIGMFFASLMMLILAILSNISFVALLSVCCGTTVDGIISYSVISVSYPVAWALIYFLPTLVLPGYVSANMSATLITALVPFLSHYLGVFLGDIGSFTSYQFIHIGWWLLFTLLCTAGSIFLIRRRHAESAQNAFAFNMPAIIIKIVSGFVGGVTLGILFSVLSYSSDLFYLWFLAGAVVGAFCVTFLLHIIYARGTKGFSRSLLQFAVAIVCICLFYIPLITGWFGYDANVPDIESVESVGVYAGDNEGPYNVYSVIEDTNTGYRNINRYIEFEDSGSFSDIINIHSAIVQDLDNIYDFPYNFDRSIRIMNSDSYDNRFYSLKLDYTLKNGKHLVREYEYAELSGEVQDMLADFVDSQKYGEKFVNSYLDRFAEIQYFEYYSYDKGISVGKEDISNMPDLLAAIKEDIKNIPNEKKDVLGNLNINAVDNEGKGINMSVNITSDFKNTLEFIDSLKETSFYQSYADTQTA